MKETELQRAQREILFWKRMYREEVIQEELDDVRRWMDEASVSLGSFTWVCNVLPLRPASGVKRKSSADGAIGD